MGRIHLMGLGWTKEPDSNVRALTGVHTDNIVGPRQSNWDTAYGWGDHSQAGYVTPATDQNTTYTSSDFTHNSLSGVNADEHINWKTANQGTINSTNLPALALTDVTTVSNQAGRLGVSAQEGDVVIQTDISKTFINNGTGTGNDTSHWTELATPTDAVTSVNSQTGAVTIDVPTLISELSNDTGFITAAHTDHLNITTNYGGITGSSAPTYSQVALEIQTASNYVPGIGFHRAGYSATTLYEYDGRLFINAWTTRPQTGEILTTGNIGTYASSYTANQALDTSSTAQFSALGIGTDTPYAPIHIKGDTSVDQRGITFGPNNGSADMSLIRVDGNVGNSTSAYYGFDIKYMGTRSGVNNSLSIFADNMEGTQIEAMTFLQDGKVGIGIDTPTALLEVGGDADSIGLIGRSQIGFIGHSDYAGFAHRDKAGSVDFALAQGPAGDTSLNSSASQAVTIATGNVP